MAGQELTLFQRDKMKRHQKRTEQSFWRKLRRNPLLTPNPRR